MQGDRGEVGAGAAVEAAGWDDGYGLPAGDEFEFVLDAFDDARCRVCTAASGCRWRSSRAAGVTMRLLV
ncbi:hypothetical protein DKM19_02840 [Streptosporangium sp. 'caverna']|nr:hypothetical protein DKM19_02840 [Streptosporangium sp. 'caverna']